MEKEKWEIVLEAIEKGGQTDETLMDLLDAKSKRAVTNQFAFIKVLKRYPIFDEESGVYVIIEGADAYAEHVKTNQSAAEAEKKWTANPQKKRETLESRLNTKTSKMNQEKGKLNDSPDDMKCKLKSTMATCDFHLAVINLTEFKEAICAELSITAEQYMKAEDLDAVQAERKSAE